MDISDVILFQLDKTNKIVKQHSQREMDERGMNITVEQWVLLKIVQENSPISQTEVAEFATRDPASITRTLDILAKKGLTERTAVPGNRRQYNVVLTRKGDEFVKEHMNFIESQRARSLNGITKEEQKSLTELLKRMRENMG